MNNKYIFTILSFIICLMILTASSFALESCEITDRINFSCIGIELNKITDNNISTHSNGENVRIELQSDIPLEGIYIKYNRTPSAGKLNGEADIALNGFLHEYISLSSDTSAVLTYTNTDICDIQVFSEGTLPDYVQNWETGIPETDILLCATHSDDDQLFFAGLLPYYAKVKKANVRVAYFVNHYDTYNRTHELLDGLWHCGVKNYPDISPFPDGYSESASDAELYLANNGFEYSDIIDFQINLINKYKPLAVVLHDINGEYGHGAHMLNTKTFIEALDTKDGYIPEKVYIHLYDENEIILPIDETHEFLGGKSPFQISQEAFRFHKSQHWTWFYSWIYGKNGNINKSEQITKYSPAKYGLYYTSVGTDCQKNDILENIITYSQREELEALKAEEVDRIKKKISEKKELLAEEQFELESRISAVQNRIRITVVVLSLLILILITTTVFLIFKFKKKR